MSEKPMLNQEHYPDYTAGVAVRNSIHPKPGEIWNDARGYEYLIIKEHGTFCTVLMLKDNPDFPIRVTSRSVKYAHPGMLSYWFNQNYGDYIKDCDMMEFSDALYEIGACLIPVSYSPDEHVDQKELAEKNARMDELIHSVQIISAERDRLQAKVKDLENAAIYKQLYENLLDRVLPRATAV